MSEQLKVGLIGYGMAGQVFHAPIINSVAGLHLAKIRETKPHNIELATKRYPNARIVDDSAAIFSDPLIDLVVIATPNVSHFPLAKESLLNGKHVVVDKPFTITSAEADDLIRLAGEKDKLISVFQNRRWDSDFKTVQKIVASQKLGDIVEVEIHFDRFRPTLKENAWREENIPGSGLLYDLGAHLIDQSLVLFGLPESVYADIKTQRQQAIVDDYFQVELHYNNLKVILKAGVLVKEPGPHYILHGTKGSFIKYGLDVQEDALKAGGVPNKVTNWGVEPEKLWGKLNIDEEGQAAVTRIESEAGDYRAYYSNIYDSICQAVPPAVQPEEARNVIYLIELARRSAQEGRVIYLDRLTR
jgi:predicted dehydrogenase